MNRYITELIGTFFLVFVIATSGNPLAIGSVLMVMVYMGGHVSGAHYNPAVTIGVYLRGAVDKADVVPYIGAQILGGFFAAVVAQFVTGTGFAAAPGADFGPVEALICEVLITFALVLVILNVATSKATEGNSYYGLAIGFTVMAGAYSVGPISGGAFNPAVGIGPIVVDALGGDGSFGNLWLYIVGPVLGGMLAAPVFKMQEGAAGGGE